MVVMRWSIRLIGLLSLVTLVRLLTPEDFGLMAMAFVFIGLLTNVTDLSVDLALVRARSVSRAQYDSAWTLRLLVGAALSLLLLLAAPLIAEYFGDERVELVVQIVSLQPLLAGLENIGIVDFRRNLDFRKEFVFYTVKKLLGAVIGLALAFALRDYTALAIGAPASAAAGTILSYVMSSFRPRFSLRHSDESWAFSKWMLVTNSSLFCAQRGDELVIGRLASAEVLGLYSVASQTSFMPTQEVLEPVGRAFLPTYARLQDDLPALYSTFWKVLGLGISVAVAFAAGIWVVADDLIGVVLGPQWLPAADYFRWLAIAGSGIGVIFLLQDMFVTLRRERFMAVVHAGHALAVVLGALVVGTTWGIDHIAPARAMITLALSVFLVVILARLTSAPFVLIAGLAARPLLAAIGMYGALTMLPAWPGDMRVLSLALDVTVGALSFAAVSVAAWVVAGRPDSAERIVVAFVRDALTRWARHG